MKMRQKEWAYTNEQESFRNRKKGFRKDYRPKVLSSFGKSRLPLSQEDIYSLDPNKEPGRHKTYNACPPASMRGIHNGWNSNEPPIHSITNKQ
jgi:hypothetical protein